MEKSTDYVRMFEVPEMPFLINSIALEHYKPLNVVAIFINNLWSTYLPRYIQEKTLQEGIILFGSKEIFEEYKRDFENYKKRAVEHFKKCLIKEKISKEELKDYFELIAEHWKYYMKTEFFYVDETYKKSKENKMIAENLKELEKVKFSGREHMNDMIFGEQCYLNKILIIISKEFGIPVNELLFYSKEEILDLYDNKRLSEEIIKERKDSYTFLTKDNNIIFNNGEKAKEFISNFLVRDYSDEIKGVIANKGKVTGRAKIFFYSSKEFDKVSKIIEEMDKGDILIAESTYPELMAACKKASAILTNQGGLLSHAAIVSRELGIPCIVGLSNITHLVKDGDYIEVDADNGIVKILKRKNQHRKI